MSLRDTAVTLAMGSGFTILGFIVQFVLQARQKTRDDQRARRSRWDEQCIDIMVDLDRALVGLLGTAALGRPIPSGAVAYAEEAASTLERALRRVMRGHLDHRVRGAAHHLEAAMLVAIPRAVAEARAGNGALLVGPSEISEGLDDLELRPWLFRVLSSARTRIASIGP